MNRYSRFPLATAIALAAVAGLVVGAGLPRTQAQPVATPDARLDRLESRVNTLEQNVIILRARLSVYGGPSIGGQPAPPSVSRIPPYSIVPLGK